MRNDQRKKHRKCYILLLIIFAALFCLSAYKVTTQLLTERKEKQAFDALIEQVSINRQANRSQTTPESAPADESPAPASPDNGQASGESHEFVTPEPEHTPAPENVEITQETIEPQASITPEPTPTEVPPMLAAYEPLYKKNHDLWGWIMIEGTEINLPVMYTPRDSEYYLHRAFDRTYSFSGVPFMDGTCYWGCGNYLIYGHHMKNGTMFAPIVNYAREDYWQEHPLIYFDTLYEIGTYEVIAAFYSTAFTSSETEGFRYYRYTDLTNPDVFAEYMEQVRSVAVYDTGLDASYGDQLLTLSTCEYSAKDNRFVVVARKIN